MEASKFLKWNLNDFSKGLIVAVVVATLTVIYSAIQSGGLASIDWGLVTETGVLSIIAYLLKNLGTNSDGALMKGE